MKKSQDQPADAAELRRRAEERLKRQRTEGGGQRTELETARLVHELRVHQIELEMQNEQIKTSRTEAEAGRALYADLYDFAPTGYLTLDREGAIRLVNLTGAQMLGVERSQLVKRRFGLFVAEGDRRAFSDFLEKVFASEAKESCEVTLPREGSQPLFVQIEGTRSADGQECRAVVLDISERKRAEVALRGAMRTLDATRDGVFIFDPATLRFSYVNQGGIKQTGYSREQLLAMTPLDIKPKFDEPRFRQIIAPLIAASGQVHSFTTIHRHKNGSDVPVEINLQCVALEDGTTRMIAIVRDITERKRVDERELDEFKKLGVHAVLEKPFTQEKLVEALKTIFQK